jgi:hypothetical protein
MDELVKMISQKTGIAEDKARLAAETAIKFLKDKLPAPIAGQIDAVLGGSGGLDDVARGLGGMLGKK